MPNKELERFRKIRIAFVLANLIGAAVVLAILLVVFA